MYLVIVYVCTIDLNGNNLNINDTLFLGSSWSNDGDIDNGLIANEKDNGGEGSKLGNLSIKTDSVVLPVSKEKPLLKQTVQQRFYAFGWYFAYTDFSF